VKRRTATGFTLLELLIVIAIGLILAAFAIPMTINATRSYQLNAAVSSASGAIQSTRYLAIMRGCPYTITLIPATNSYQVASSSTCTTAYSPGAIPITGAGGISISRSATFTFAPGGTVSEASNNMTFSITNEWGGSHTITVSGVGNVTVRTP
jgi:prepilin-type N-terminal cleavage/methylation domain-containing protein